MRQLSTITNIQQMRKQFQNKNRFKTHVNIKFDPSNMIQQHKYLPHQQSSYISNFIIQQILTNNVQQKLQQIQMKRIVDQSLREFQSIFQQFKAQNNPYGPEEEIFYENILKIEEQPITRLFDPMLGFEKIKHVKAEQKNKVKQKLKVNHSQQVIQNKQRRPSKISGSNSIMRSSKLSIISQKSVISSPSNFYYNLYNNPALIPLRIQNQRLQQINAKRNLQDFLRQKKNNRQSTLFSGGFTKNKVSYEDKDMLKIIQQYERTKNISREANSTTKSNNNNGDKTVMSPKEQFAFDYNGDNILLKKKSFSNLKNNLKILKSPYKIKQTILGSPNDKKNKQKKIFRIQNLPELKQNYYNKRNKALTARGHTQEQIKQKIQNCLKTERVKFRQLDQNQTTINLKQDQINMNFQFVKNSTNLVKNVRSERGTGKSGKDQKNNQKKDQKKDQKKYKRNSNIKGLGNNLYQAQSKNIKLLGLNGI